MINRIIPYLNIDSADDSKLKALFEDGEVRRLLERKWEELSVQESLTDDVVEDVSGDDKITVCEPSDKEVDQDNINESVMPIIPNIPDDDETLARKKGEFDDFKDEALNQKLKSKFIQLQNGKVNQPYSYLFDITSFEVADIGQFWFEGLEAIGLRFNSSTDLIEGTPTCAGDHKIVFKCKRNAWVEGDPVFERPITLIVNPDPRSLWNTIPTPVDIDYYYPDSDCKYVKVDATPGFLGFGRKNRKDIVAASQRGRSHAHEGKPRDDSFEIMRQDENGWYIMVVADGAGSAQYSRQGSHIACSTVTEVCNAQLNKYNEDVCLLIKDFDKDKSESKRKKLGDALYNIIGSAVFKAYKDIEKEAQAKNAVMKDYATTLLVTVAKYFKFGWFVSSFWVGDGAIGIYNKETRFLKVMGEPDGGEFAGQTRFLTMPEIMQPTEIYRRLRFEIIEDFTAIVMMSDGVTDPKFETDSNLMKIEKWDALWDDLCSSVEFVNDNEEAAPQLLKWLDFWSPGNHDDRTIAVLY